MRALFVAALDGVVRDEPGVAAAAEVVRGCAPARDVRLVLIFHADRPATERRVALRREMEHELVAIVEEPLAVDRLVMADGQVLLETGSRAGQRLFNRDRFDPMDRVLKLQMRARGLRHIERGPRVGRLTADVQKKGAFVGERPRRQLHPLAGPFQVGRTRHRVVVGAVADAEIVRRRGDDDVERPLRNTGEDIERVAEIEPKGCAADFEGGVRLGETSHRWLVVGS